MSRIRNDAPLDGFARPATMRGSPALVLAAHPDDEILGCGSLLLADPRRFTIVHVTDGAPGDLRDARAAGCATAAEYAALRRRELERALALAGIPPARCRCLGLQDQTAARQLTSLTRTVAALITEVRPGVILTHAYEGGHPDHDATAFAAAAALRLLAAGPATPAAAPVLVEFAGYHAAGGVFRTGTFIDDRRPCLVRRLSPEERSAKQRMLACFASQAATLCLFDTACERFRVAPAYDFRRPPHPPPLNYDHFDWGLRSEAWPALVEAAEAELFGIGSTSC